MIPWCSIWRGVERNQRDLQSKMYRMFHIVLNSLVCQRTVSNKRKCYNSQSQFL
jgi:hypothetical protein